MRILRPGLPFAIVFGSLAAFCVAGHFAVTAFIEALQVRQLSDLADVVLRRSEAAVDFASASIDEIASGAIRPRFKPCVFTCISVQP
jgi:hypothetical protein